MLGLVGAGESFGEAAALLGAPSPFNAVAMTEAQVLAIPLEALALLRLDRSLLRDLSERRLIAVSRRDITILDREQLQGIR